MWYGWGGDFDSRMGGGSGNVETPPVTEMEASSVSNVQQSRNGEYAAESHQAIAILEFIVVNNAEGDFEERSRSHRAGDIWIENAEADEIREF